MYKLVFAFLSVIVTAFAFGQTAATMSSTYQPANHTETASHQSLQTERSLVSNNVTTATGEMPISDVPLPPVYEEPLGSVARRYRLLSKDAQASSAPPILKRSAGAFPGWYLAY